jgi:hypothetical protein
LEEFKEFKEFKERTEEGAGFERGPYWRGAALERGPSNSLYSFGRACCREL